MSSAKNKTISKKVVEAVKSSDLKLPMPIYANIDIDLIHTNFNIRFSIEDSDFTSLYESIKVNGIIEPLIVNKVTGIDDYDLVAGERRLRCACELDMNTVPCIVYSDLTDSQFFEIMLSENLIREDLNPIEEAIGFKKIIEAGMAQTELAEHIGRSQGFISQRLQLLDIPDILQHQIITRVITPGHVRELSKFSNAPLANDFYQFYETYQKKMQADDEKGSDYTVPIKDIDEVINDFFDDYRDKHTELDLSYYFSGIGNIISDEKCPLNERCSKCDHRFGDICLDVDCVLKTKERYTVWRNEQRAKSISDRSEISVIDFNVNQYYRREHPLTPEDCNSCPNIEERKRSYNDSMYFVCTNPDCFKEKEKILIEHLVSEEKEVRSSINDALINSRKDDAVPDIISFLFDEHLSEISGMHKSVFGVKMNTKAEFTLKQKQDLLQLLFLFSKVPSDPNRYLSREDYDNFAADVKTLGYSSEDV